MMKIDSDHISFQPGVASTETAAAVYPVGTGRDDS